MVDDSTGVIPRFTDAALDPDAPELDVTGGVAVADIRWKRTRDFPRRPRPLDDPDADAR
jgi:hypothetical protein